MSPESGLEYLTAAYRIKVRRYILSVMTDAAADVSERLIFTLISRVVSCRVKNVVNSCSRWLQEQQYQAWNLRSLSLQPLTPVPR